MQDLTIRLNKDTSKEEIAITLPQQWNELKPFQLLYIAKHYEHWKKLSETSAFTVLEKAKLFLELSGINSRSDKKRLCRYLSFVDKTSDVSVLSLTDFVFEKLDLTKNLLPTIKVGFFTNYRGPGDRLQDTVIEEFSFAFHAYNQYNNRGLESDLNDLCAVLYRPANSSSEMTKTGDSRVTFNHKTIGERALRFAQVPVEYKAAVYLYFRGCIEYLAQSFKMVFSRAEGQQRKSGGSFIDAILALSGSKFGDFNTTKTMDTFLVLKHMNELLIEAEKNKKP